MASQNNRFSCFHLRLFAIVDKLNMLYCSTLRKMVVFCGNPALACLACAAFPLGSLLRNGKGG
jgi:hypothetical protein